MTARSGFVPDEQHRASRELLKQVGMRAGPVSEYFPVRNEGQPGVEDVIRSGCARSDSQPAWIGRSARCRAARPTIPVRPPRRCSQLSAIPETRVRCSGGECGEALSAAPTGVEARACPDRHPVARARSHLTTRRHVRAGVIATQALPIVDVVGERVVHGGVLDLVFVRSTYTFFSDASSAFSDASIRSTRPAGNITSRPKRIRCPPRGTPACCSASRDSKLFSPLSHSSTKSAVVMWPAIRCGRSEK